MKPILEIKNIRKNFNGQTAVDGVSFKVREGICFGLLGPNGAGKTTTLEIIEDIITPDNGQIFYQGQPRSSSFREEIGIQFQHTSLLNFLTVAETLDSFHRLYQEPDQINNLIERCELTPLLNKRNNQLSGGQLQRLMLALALINRPQLVFLDEPSTGLDPQSRRNLWAIVQQVKAEGKTIILTTHSMEEAEYLCDEIAIMDHGKIIAWDTPSRLIKSHCHGSYILLPRNALRLELERLPFPWTRRNNSVALEVAQLHEAMDTLLDLDVDLSEMSIHSPNLEDVFLTLTGRKLRD